MPYLEGKARASELGDYYLKDGEWVEAPGRWAGGADLFGLDYALPVTGDQLRTLMDVRRLDTGGELRRQRRGGRSVGRDVLRRAGHPEHELWPDAVPPPSEPPEREQPTPLVTDVVAGYGHATDRDAPNPDDVLRLATERIELIIPNVVSGLVDRAYKGRRRLSRPGDRREPRGAGRTAPRYRRNRDPRPPGGEEFGLYRADDQMLLVLPRIGVLSEPAPVIVLKRRTSGRLFDRLANEFEERREQTTPLPTRECLHVCLAEVEPELRPEPNPDSEPSTPSPPTSATPTGPDPNAPRRWPRRPT